MFEIKILDKNLENRLGSGNNFLVDLKTLRGVINRLAKYSLPTHCEFIEIYKIQDKNDYRNNVEGKLLRVLHRKYFN